VASNDGFADVLNLWLMHSTLAAMQNLIATKVEPHTAAHFDKALVVTAGSFSGMLVRRADALVTQCSFVFAPKNHYSLFFLLIEPLFLGDSRRSWVSRIQLPTPT
jgi:hypothetical protein